MRWRKTAELGLMAEVGAQNLLNIMPKLTPPASALNIRKNVMTKLIDRISYGVQGEVYPRIALEVLRQDDGKYTVSDVTGWDGFRETEPEIICSFDTQEKAVKAANAWVDDFEEDTITFFKALDGKLYCGAGPFKRKGAKVPVEGKVYPSDLFHWKDGYVV